MVPAESPPSHSPSKLTIGLITGAAVIVAVLAVFLMRSLARNVPDASTPAAQAPASAASAAALAAQPGPQWNELTASQQAVLQPLAMVWNSLGLLQKKKWINLAKDFPARTPENQARLQERMVQWAALTPRERELARLNFAQTKKLSADERAASWAAYQELSAEEKARLAATAARKPTGSAVAIAPTPNDKLTAIPITRHTSAPSDSAALLKPQLDPNTLLPKVVIPAPSTDASTSSPEPESKPVVSSDTLSPN